MFRKSKTVGTPCEHMGAFTSAPLMKKINTIYYFENIKGFDFSHQVGVELKSDAQLMIDIKLKFKTIIQFFFQKLMS